MTGLRRGFLAVVPPPAVLRWTDALAESARGDEDLRWTRSDQRHLTLQFLGAVDDADALIESVTESVLRVQPFTLALGGAGAFPSVPQASVVWLGVSTGAAELTALAGAVATEDRPFQPHLTLARVNPPRDVRALVERLESGPAGPPFTVDRVVLFDSTPSMRDARSDGAIHTPHVELGLGGGLHEAGA